MLRSGEIKFQRVPAVLRLLFARSSGVYVQLNGFFELVEGISDGQEDFLFVGVAQEFRSPQHQVHRINFHAQIQGRIENVQAVFQPDQGRIGFQIAHTLTKSVEPVFDVPYLRGRDSIFTRLFDYRHGPKLAIWLLRGIIENFRFICHQRLTVLLRAL